MKTLCLSLVLTIAVCVAEEEPGIAAARALGSLRDASDLPKLVEALVHSDKNVRFYAAYALGEIKDGAAGRALLQVL